MPTAIVQGVFMGVNVKKSSFDGKEKSALYLDLYQPDSDQQDKMVQIKSDDISLITAVKDDYSQGSIVQAKVSINAYKNKAYFKLIDFVS